MGCKRSRHNFNLFGFYNQADHIYQRRPNKVPSESVRPQNSLWQAVSQRLRQGQWYFRPVIETSNEGGFGRTSEGWDFHETDTLSVVPDVPPQRRLRINIAENRLRNRTKAKRKVIPHCFCCFYRTNLCSADITQVREQTLLHLRYIYINLTKEKSKMNKYG